MPKMLKWNVLVNLAGDNNLGSECVYALTEMKRIGSNDEVAVIAQLDTTVHEFTPLFIKREKEEFFQGVTGEELVASQKAVAEAEMAPLKPRFSKAGGKPAPVIRIRKEPKSYFDSVLSFFQDSIRKYPSEHYMVVLSGHGAGILGDFLSKQNGDQMESLNAIDMAMIVKQIGEAINQMRENRQLPKLEQPIDILGLDNCLMGMTEVAYAVHKFARIMIGAEGFEPMAGWPYALVLKAVKELAARTDNGGTLDQVKQLSRKIVMEYTTLLS